MSHPAGEAARRLAAPRDPIAACRSRVYALFVEAFAYPQGSAGPPLLNGDLMGAVHEAFETLSPGSPAVAAAGPHDAPATMAELRQRYSALFDVGGGRPRVSLLERRYAKQAEHKLWDELLSFYVHFGLDFASGHAEEQPDHLRMELGFMHYLSFLEAGAARGAAALRRGQRDFLALHLTRWVPSLADRLNAADAPEPYRSVGALVARFVASDLERIERRLAADA